MKATTLDFLRKLAKNNNKEWFQSHRKDYEDAKRDFVDFMSELAHEVAKFDDSVKGEPSKSIKIFRINKDIRFSKDKSPYKLNFGGLINFMGVKSMKAGYYFHLQPGKSGIAGGLHELDPKSLHKTREYISENLNEFEGILGEERFRKVFGELESEGALKTVPRGFDKDNPAIEYLRLKRYVGWKSYSDSLITAAGLAKQAASDLEAIKPLNDFLTKALKE